MLKIPELREKAKKSLGDNFHIRQFREVINLKAPGEPEFGKTVEEY